MDTAGNDQSNTFLARTFSWMFSLHRSGRIQEITNNLERSAPSRGGRSVYGIGRRRYTLKRIGADAQMLRFIKNPGPPLLAGNRTTCDFTQDARLKLELRKSDMYFLGCGWRCETSPWGETGNLGPAAREIAPSKKLRHVQRTRGKIWFDGRHRRIQPQFAIF